jgi:hypothetical protein
MRMATFGSCRPTEVKLDRGRAGGDGNWNIPRSLQRPLRNAAVALANTK